MAIIAIDVAGSPGAVDLLAVRDDGGSVRDMLAAGRAGNRRGMIYGYG